MHTTLLAPITATYSVSLMSDEGVLLADKLREQLLPYIALCTSTNHHMVALLMLHATMLACFGSRTSCRWTVLLGRDCRLMRLRLTYAAAATSLSNSREKNRSKYAISAAVNPSGAVTSWLRLSALLSQQHAARQRLHITKDIRHRLRRWPTAGLL